MFEYSMEDVKRVANRTATEVAAEEAAVRETLKIIIKEDTADLWGQRSMAEVLGFQEANSYCNHVAGWLR